MPRKPTRGRKTRRHSLPENYTYAPDPETSTPGQRLAHTHRLSADVEAGHTPVAGERYVAQSSLWDELGSPKSALLCGALTEAERTANPEHVITASCNLLTHLTDKLPKGWVAIFGDAALFTEPR